MTAVEQKPSKFSPELGAVICCRLTEGQSLSRICREADMPHLPTVMGWIERNDQFRTDYARARALQVERMADELNEIADDGSNDFERNERGEIVVNHDHINRSKLRIDTRKWILSKMLPKRYGDKVALEHSGPDGGPIETLDTSKVPLGDLTRLVDMLGATNGSVPVKVLENGANGNGNGRHS